VSQHIHNLESRVGAALFSRGKDLGVTPTPAGEAYYLRCLDLLKAHTLAHRMMEDFAPGVAGEVTVGLMPAMTRRQLPTALESFMDANPNVSVRVFEAYSHVLTEKVSACELDFAIVPRTSHALVGLKETPLVSTREYVVSCRSGPTRCRSANS
jgi:DNA-binding transcriptional LysR family regulator